MSNLVKICKRPFIAEDTDRWGQGLGTYSVYATEVGFVEQEFWNDLKAFENYSNTPEGKAEQEQAKKDLEAGKKSEELDMPLMSRLIDKSKGLLWQFNMRITDNPGTEQEYMRSYASFDCPTLREWTPEHDKEIKKLELKAKEMNR